jgi:tRNA-dihydrouridine synthase
MLARGALGNPWLFARMLGTRDADPTPEEVVAELHWVMDRAVEHLGPERAGRYLRKFYPWYVERLGGDPVLQAELQRTTSVEQARSALLALRALSPPDGRDLHAEGRHPHPRRPREAEGGARRAHDHQAA